MSLKSKYWAMRYGLSSSDTELIEDALNSVAASSTWFEEGYSKLVIARRKSLEQPIRGNVHESNGVFAISKDSLNLVESSLLKKVIRIILNHNKKLTGGQDARFN